METSVYASSAGEVWLWAEPGAADDGRPVVLFINGAFAIERPRSFELPGLMPEAAVFNAHLPGNHCPALASPSVEAFAAAYSAALDQIGRPAIVIGASIGALVAMSLRSPTLRGVVLLEPPLQTGALWPLQPTFRQMAAARPSDTALRDFLWAIFGFSRRELRNRDYRPLLGHLDTPGWAVFGGQPLMPERAYELVPSLVDEPDRALLAAHPKLRTAVIAGVGHNVPGHAIGHVVQYARDLMGRHLLADRLERD
jgi:hypothetical protein